MQPVRIEELPQVPEQLRRGMWIAWYRGHAISTHADNRVLADLMEAEGLADKVWYTRDHDGTEAAPASAAD